MTDLDFRRLAAEFTGAALLVLIGAGSAVLAAVNGLGALYVALGHLLALAGIVYAFGGISGAHVNPAVTLALAAGGRFPWRDVPGYIVAQLLGGIAGAGLLGLAYGEVWLRGGLGATRIVPGLSEWRGLYIEALGAFILVLAVMVFMVNPATPRALAGLGIGGALGSAILIFGPATGASLNFARTLGPEVVLGLTDHGDSAAWEQIYIYAVGPIVGAVLAVLLYSWIAGLWEELEETADVDSVPEDGVEDEVAQPSQA